MLFATFVIEREPTRLADFLPLLMAWLQSVGAIASLGLGIFLWMNFFRGKLVDATQTAGRRVLASLARFGAYGALLGMAFVLAVMVLHSIGTIRIGNEFRPGSNPNGFSIGDYIFAGAGLLALFVVSAPVLYWLFFEASPRRIGAIVRLSLKEALAGKVIFVFGAFSLVFLFAEWFIQYKAEHQVRNYVFVFYWTMLPLFILCAAILGSFSIPADIKSQTIHTIVTKPITKFEVVIGRFLGYAILLTAGLFGVALLSLGYIARGVTEEAAAESFKARVATFGRLEFIGTKNRFRADSVGREDHRRSYIGGQNPNGPAPRQYAVWLFDDLSAVRPRGKDADMVRVEFTFDIFRLTKGDEGKGVNVTFDFAPGNLSAPEIERLANETGDKISNLVTKEAATDKKLADGDARIARGREMWKTVDAERGVYRVPGVEVVDYHTLPVEFPYGLIETLRKLHDELPPQQRAQTPVMQVLVSIDRDRASSAQMLGVARHDFYLLAAENSFYLNFMKGVVGMWCCVMVVLGVAVALSTYLSGVITLVTTLFLFIAGAYMPSIMQIVDGQSFGGGPTESMYRLIGRIQPSMPLDESAATSLVKVTDDAFRFGLARFLNLLPDVQRYDLQPYVANGFDIPAFDVLVVDNLLALIAYLIPWAILAYYLIHFREIANPT
jgi:hypothetical protein